MGEYSSRLISGVPKDNLEKFFIKREDNQDQLYKVHPKVKNLVTFKELNLLSTWPMKQQFDIIFCRNVVIYFDQKTQDALWPRFRSSLKPSGVLFLGHSERIVDPESLGFINDGATTYRPSQNKDQIN
jgi:chemotaxis protein methyltransferase CheR